MSELSREVRPISDDELNAPVQSRVKPVTVWAAVGGALLLLQLYVWIRWVTGPYFERVPSGPGDPPMYMKVPLVANAVCASIGLPLAVWWFIVRPWRRERRITLDGMLLLSCGLMFFQDPLLNYLEHVVHLQHLEFQPRFVVVEHPWMGVARSARPPGRRTAADQHPGLCPQSVVHHHGLLGDAQSRSPAGQTSATSS